MRTYALLPAIAISLLAAGVDASPPDSAREDLPHAAAVPATGGVSKLEFEERFILDAGRVPFEEPKPRKVSFQIHGELQFRGLGYSDVPLQPRIGAAPGEGASLGSRGRMVHWLRLKPVFQYTDKLRIVGELDAPVGMAAGQTTALVSAAIDDYETLAWYGIRPRQLYVEYQSPIGMLRAGQQTSHWGMGLLANDGDHPSLFGDYRRGALVERLLFATRPLGKDSPLSFALAGDLVFQDSRALLVQDIPPGTTPASELGATMTPPVGRDRALQAVAAVRWQQKHVEAGIYGVYRHQRRKNQATDALTSFDEYLDVGILDLAAKFNAPVAGSSSFVFGEFEAAYIGGKTNYLRNVELVQAGLTESIQSWGGAARLGAVHVAGHGPNAFGDLVVAVEYGFATGDADPYDGVTRRFTLDQNHNVGLVLFDHVLAWKTARSATIAQDPRVTFRPSPGLEFLPSEGGIFGTAYFNPTVVLRPRRWLDVKAGVVVAQTTADMVDPFQVGALGRYANYEGGSPTKLDLGVELDGGLDARFPMKSGFVVQLGAEGGVFFPGGAFSDATGQTMPTQFLVNSRLGVQY